MANRTRPRTRRPPWLWIGLGGIVVAAALVAVIASSGSKDERAGTTSSGIEETRPVRVTGASLPVLPDGADPAVGTATPELRGAGFDGAPVEVTHDGRPKLLVFVAHWCPHCQREVPLLVDHLRDRPLPAGVDLVAIATATTPDRPNYPPSAWLDREGWTSPVLADSGQGEAATAFGLPGFPYFVAVDARGNVAARTSGEISVDQFEELVRAATAGPS